MPKRRPKSERESPWAEVGTDAEYQEFIRTLPSAYSGKRENIVYAHYRTAANSGTGFKPPYSGIPLTWKEHQHQHQIGQYSFAEKEWWEEKTQEYLKLWKSQKGITGDFATKATQNEEK